MAHLVERYELLVDPIPHSNYVPPVRQRMDGAFRCLFGPTPSQKYWGFKAESLRNRLYETLGKKVGLINQSPLNEELPPSCYLEGIDRLNKEEIDKFVAQASLTFVVENFQNEILGRILGSLKKENHFEVMSVLEVLSNASKVLFESHDKNTRSRLMEVISSEVPDFEEKATHLRVASFVASEFGVGRGNITFNKGLNTSIFGQNIIIVSPDESLFNYFINNGFSAKKVNAYQFDNSEEFNEILKEQPSSKPRI